MKAVESKIKNRKKGKKSWQKKGKK